MADDRPLILTALLDPASQEFFEHQRRRWFPPHLNMIPAHITLFHHLPAARLDAIRLELSRHCADWRETPFSVDGLRFLGRGVAYCINAPGLAAFQGRLAGLWQNDLTPQDRQRWRPHVTIQNKVAPAAARLLHDRLRDEFMPIAGMATGVQLWRYLSGPWASEGEFRFAAAPAYVTPPQPLRGEVGA